MDGAAAGPVGAPLDFSDYAGGGRDREVLRWVTDEIMDAVQELSGQDYVDAYGARSRRRWREGRELDAAVVGRPGEGRSKPPMPPALVPPAATGLDRSDPTLVADVTSDVASRTSKP